MSNVRWDGVPPSIPRISVHVYTVPKGATVFARLLGAWHGVWLHWLPALGPHGRSQPCRSPDCPYCPDPGLHWYAYVPSLVYRAIRAGEKADWFPQALELTENAIQPLLEVVELAGLVVELKRENKRNGRLELKPLENANAYKWKAPPPAAPAFDVRPILERLWGHWQLAAARLAAEESTAGPPAGDGAVIPFPAAPPPEADGPAARRPEPQRRPPAKKRRKHL